MKMILAGFVLLLVIACGRGDRVPDNVLPREKMEAVLWDMIQADEFLKDFYKKLKLLSNVCLSTS